MNQFFSSSRTSAAGGFSVTEMLMTVAVLGLLAAVAAFAATSIRENSQHRKLDADVQALNSAIRIYLATGGNMDGVTTATGVLNKLKSSRSKADKELHVGAPSGRMIDPRVSVRNVAVDSWKARAIYNAASYRFEVQPNGEGFEFFLDEALANVSPTIETRDGTVSYAKTSSWVWDHTSTSNPTGAAGPSVFGTNPNPTNSTPSTAEPEPEPEPEPVGGGGPDPDPEPEPEPEPEPPRLPYPSFDKDNGAHPEGDFPLVVTITNVPSSADGSPMYQINSDAWQPYTAPVSVPMNSSLRAQFITVDPSRYRESHVRYAYFYPVPESLSGSADGDFHSPSGGPNLHYEIKNGNDYFEHGDSVYILDGEPVNTGAPNSLNFAARNFANVAPGETFKLGDLLYHNGNSYYDSHATKVLLKIKINLPDRGQQFDFDLNLDLVNTENDPDDPAASADYVRITNLQQNINLEINGVAYRMQLAFGATDSFGFSSSSQFHVYEGATGAGELLATFIAN